MNSNSGELSRSSVDFEMRPPSPAYDVDLESPRATSPAPSSFEIPMQYSEERSQRETMLESVEFQSPSQYPEEREPHATLPGSVEFQSPSQYPEERAVRATMPGSVGFESPSQYPEERAVQATMPGSVGFESLSWHHEEWSLQETLPESFALGSPSQYPEERAVRATMPGSVEFQSPPQSPEERTHRATLPASFENPIHYSKKTQPHKQQQLSVERLLHKTIISEIEADGIYGSDTDTWAYLSYMEYNKRLMGAYVAEKEFFIDNSAEPMNSKRVGLASLPPPPRNSEIARIKYEIHKGIVLLTDPQGNIYLINESKIPVIIKGYNQPENHCLSEEVILRHGSIMPGKESVTVFDIEEFRSQIALQLVGKCEDKEQLRQMSFISLCFGEARPDLQSPCWLLICNMKAFNMAGDEEVRTEVQEYIAQISCDKNKTIQKKKKNVNAPKKIHQEPRRKLRIKLRQGGQSICNYVEYSWNDVYFKNDESTLNLEILKEQFEEPVIDYNEDKEEGDDDQRAENQLQEGLQRLKTIAKKSSTTKKNGRPIKHWAKLSYKIKQYSGNEVTY